MKIEYKAPHVPQGREQQRNQEHRRMAESIETRFQSDESYIDALIKSFNEFLAENNLSGWNPPRRGGA